MAFDVIHAGYPGDNTRAMLKRMDKDVLIHAPTAVTIQCGTNDSVNPRAFVPVDEFSGNLTEIIARIKNKTNAEILLIAPPPCISSEVVIRYKFPDEYKNTDLNIKLKEYVDRMGNTATENKIPFINLFTLFSGKKRIGLTQDSLIRNKLNSGIEDGAHPTEEGYLLIGKTVYNNLITEGFDCTRLVCFGDSLTFGYPYGGMGTLEGNNFPAAVSRLLNGETE